MTITMKRKVMSEMMATYFPSLLLIMITYATTFFNLTTMLPPMSATKMIDFWLILCQLVPFAQVVLLTASEYLRDEKKDIDEGEDEAEEEVFEDGQGTESKEAWKAPIKKRPKTQVYLKLLQVIGTFELLIHIISFYPQRRKFCR